LRDPIQVFKLVHDLLEHGNLPVASCVITLGLTSFFCILSYLVQLISQFFPRRLQLALYYMDVCIGSTPFSGELGDHDFLFAVLVLQFLE